MPEGLPRSIVSSNFFRSAGSQIDGIRAFCGIFTVGKELDKSVFVYPEVDDSFEVEINPADLRIDTYRASGAGGQHINKTDSAVRLTHNPTGIVVQCQNDRSQHRNKDEAMNMLRAKLFELELRKRNEAKQSLEDSKSDVGWGHQIRSYVFDQSRIKDLRTNYEVGNIKAVMDGDLDDFIAASLKQGV